MSIRQKYPNLKPTLVLDFANTKALDPRITYTRPSTARYYDGNTTAKAEENLFRFSQDYVDDVIWIKGTAVTVTSNNATAPDGTTTASTLSETATNDSHTMNQSAFPFLINTPVTYSFFAKSGSSNFVQLLVNTTNGNYFSVVSNLNTGIISQTNTSGMSLLSSSITSVGSGWYRIVCSFINPDALGVAAHVGLSNSATPTIGSFGHIVYNGNASNNIQIWGAQVEFRSFATPYVATNDLKVSNGIPVLLEASPAQPRFDHNPVTRESLGLLMEYQATNLFLQSQRFDSAAWSKTSAASIVVGSNISPDGLMNAQSLLGSGAINQGPFNGRFTQSIYAKMGNVRWLRLFRTSSPTNGVWFDLQDGVVGTINGSVITTDIIPVGNGWYRCSVSWGTLEGDLNAAFGVGTVDGATTNPAGGFAYIWGAQLEQNSSLTSSYIRTEGSQVTRATDYAVMTDSNFYSWFNPAEWTMYSEVSTLVRGSTLNQSRSMHFYGFNNSPQHAALNGTNFRITSHTTSPFSAQNRPGFLLSTGSSGSLPNGSVDLTGIAPPQVVESNRMYKAAVSLNRDAFSLSVDNLGTNSIPNGGYGNSPTRLFIGYGAVGGNAPFEIDGHIRKLAYYPKSMSESELQALTT